MKEGGAGGTNPKKLKKTLKIKAELKGHKGGKGPPETPQGSCYGQWEDQSKLPGKGWVQWPQRGT